MQDAISDIENAIVMGNEDHGRAVLAREVLDQFHHVATGLLVQRRCGLIRQYDLGTVDESPGNAGALLLSAGQFSRELVLMLGQPDPCEDRGNALFRFLSLDAGELQRHLHVLVNRQAVEQVVGLEDIADLPAHLEQGSLTSIEEFIAEHPDAALLC